MKILVSTHKNPSRNFEKKLIEFGFRKIEKRLFVLNENKINEIEKSETFDAFKMIEGFTIITGENLTIH